MPATGETTIFVYDAGGALAAEYSTQSNPEPKTSYLTTDHLGSPRVITDANGEVIARRDFMPFGEEIGVGVGLRTEILKYSPTGSDNIRKRFTGYEKDDETGLDFAEARMYQNLHGRFTAVDPLLASANAADPQTFNRYTYTGNNPINRTDPSGLTFCISNSTGIITWNGTAGSARAEGSKSVDGQTLTLGNRSGGQDSFGNEITPGSRVQFNGDGTTRVMGRAVQEASSGNAPAAGSAVQQGQNETISTGAADLATSVTPRGMLSLPCPPEDSACGSGNVPFSSPLSQGASADEVLDASQTILESIGLIPGFEAADAVSGLISLGRGDTTGAILSAAAIVPLGGQAFTGMKWARRAGALEKARELGIAGERAVGITGAKKAIDVGGRKLFPDAVTDIALIEVKNVKRQGYTKQLKAYQKHAKSNNLDFILWTRPNTKISKHLQKEIDAGTIIRKCFGGKCR